MYSAHKSHNTNLHIVYIVILYVAIHFMPVSVFVVNGLGSTGPALYLEHQSLSHIPKQDTGASWRLVTLRFNALHRFFIEKLSW